jgi:imidazolonepropionase
MFFCETGYFTVEKRTNYECWCHFGLKPKIHVNSSIQLAGSSRVKHKALSVDHLEIMTPEDIEL